VARWISFARITVVSVGIFLGFFYLGSDMEKSLAIVTVTTVGIVGVLAWVGHFIFHKSDAARLGWQTDRPDWMWEVGFANLAFGFMGLLAVFAGWGIHAQALALLGYSFYLFQAAMLHLYRYLTDEVRSRARLYRAVLLTLVYVAMMTFFAVYALVA
jgi:hypothetical protein